MKKPGALELLPAQDELALVLAELDVVEDLFLLGGVDHRSHVGVFLGGANREGTGLGLDLLH